MSALHNLSEPELVAKSRRNRFEEWIIAHYIWISLLCATAICLFNLFGLQNRFNTLTGDICISICLLFVSQMIIIWIIERLSTFRCRRYLAELQRRFGFRPLQEYVKDARKRISPDETILLLIGKSLPDFRNCWIYISIKNGQRLRIEYKHGPTLESQIASPFDFGSGLIPSKHFEICHKDLSESDAHRILNLACQIKFCMAYNFPRVKDGFPVRGAVINGKTRKSRLFRCNLASSEAKYQRSIPYQLSIAMIQLGQSSVNHPSIQS